MIHRRPSLSASLSRTVGFAAATWVALAALTPLPAAAQTEGDYLYNVAMLRAAPGEYAGLIAALEEASSLHEQAGDQAPFWIRHSQGDQWDFMLIYPIGDSEAYYSSQRVPRRAAVWDTEIGRRAASRLEAVTAYHEEWSARSIALDEMTRRFDGMGLFHIEMFAGIPGKRGELLEQRRMENRYYTHLNRQLNVLFVREGGPNWDAMTIGFYESLQTYAQAGVRFSAQEQDEAAREGGFTGVDAIGPYLRSLLSYHRDTLGVAVR
jgi:hypothetical protein